MTFVYIMTTFDMKFENFYFYIFKLLLNFKDINEIMAVFLVNRLMA